MSLDEPGMYVTFHGSLATIHSDYGSTVMAAKQARECTMTTDDILALHKGG